MKPKASRLGSFGVCLEPEQAGIDILELDVEMLRELVWSERLIVLRGFNTFTGADDFADYCERWGKISQWPYGKVLELVERDNPVDHIFDNNYFHLHWDGMYRPQVPEFQMFHCVAAPGSTQGGRTTFSNTVGALERASDSVKALWSKVTATYQFKTEFFDSKTVSPIIDKHPLRGFSVIRYSEVPRAGFVNPPVQEFTGVSTEEIAELHRTLRAALFAPENYYAHAWRQGDLVVADNFSLLHGREGFQTRAPRHLRRVHVLSNPPLDNPHLVSHK